MLTGHLSSEEFCTCSSSREQFSTGKCVALRSDSWFHGSNLCFQKFFPASQRPPPSIVAHRSDEGETTLSKGHHQSHRDCHVKENTVMDSETQEESALWEVHISTLCRDSVGSGSPATDKNTAELLPRLQSWCGAKTESPPCLSVKACRGFRLRLQPSVEMASLLDEAEGPSQEFDVCNKQQNCSLKFPTYSLPVVEWR